MSSAAWERYRREQRRQTIGCAVEWAFIVAVVLLVSVAVSHAKQEQTKPEIRQFDTQKAVSAVPAVPPCLRHLSPGDRPQFVFRSADGTVIIVGSEDVRKRC